MLTTMRRALRGRPWLTLAMLAGSVLLFVGCTQLSEEEQGLYDEAKVEGAALAEQLAELGDELAGLVEAGKSIATRIRQVKADAAAGKIDALKALDIVAEAGQLAAENAARVQSVHARIDGAMQRAKKVAQLAGDLRKKNFLAWASLVGNLALSLLTGVVLKKGSGWKRAFGVVSRAADRMGTGFGAAMNTELGSSPISEDEMRLRHAKAKAGQA